MRARGKDPAAGIHRRDRAGGSGAPARTRGDKDGGGSSGGGGGGGGGGGRPPLHKRSSDNEFRDVLGKGLANARRNMVTVGMFSIAVNLLVLAIPIYLFNMSDRVLTSRSTDTLVMLTIIVIIAIAAHVLMDMMRRIILMRVAVETEAQIGRTGAERRRQGRAERIQPRIPDTGRPAAPPRRSSPVRCC